MKYNEQFFVENLTEMRISSFINSLILAFVETII